MTDIENNFSDNTFFIAYLRYPENNRVDRKIIRAIDMAQTITTENLPEHFGVDKKYIRTVKILQAYSQNLNANKTSEYYNNLLKVTPNNLSHTSKSGFEFKPIIIIQGLAYNRFFTEPFFINTLDEAHLKLNRICKSAVILNTIHTRILKSITLD